MLKSQLKTRLQFLEASITPQLSSSILKQAQVSCDCFHDYAPVAHYLSLLGETALSGARAPIENGSGAERCFRLASWIASMSFIAPDDFVPAQVRYLCSWCFDEWSEKNPTGYFEPLT